MPAPSIVLSNISYDLKPAPINPSWILEGTPNARNVVLSRSQDATAVTLLWDCTPGKFEWFYNEDETIHILEGVVLLDDGINPERRIGPGDVVFFPVGSHAVWTVQTHVRKLAFFRCALPAPLGLMVRISRRVRTMLRAQKTAKPVAAPKLAVSSAK